MSHSILKGVSDEFNVQQTVHVYKDYRTSTPVQCEFRFKRPDTRKLTELARDINKAVRDQDFESLAEILRDQLIGWKVPGNDGNEVEFNDENIEAVCSHPDYLTGLTNAYTKVLNPGVGKAKN